MNVVMEERIVERARLARHTTYKVGGAADRLVIPGEVESVAQWLSAGDVTAVIGGGSNLLVADSGIRGTVLLLAGTMETLQITVHGDDVVAHVGAGCDMTKLAGLFMKQGIDGFAFGYGLPGTVGGALKMNAGTTHGDMRGVVEKVTLVRADGLTEEISAAACRFGYRTSAFPEGSVIVEATMRFKKGNPETIHRAMREGYDRRKATQPLDLPSAGSVFKNPTGDYAGRLIEAVGMKGTAVGGAMVSKKHANFIVNTGDATATDIATLIGKVEARVEEAFGIRLEREIRLLGDFDR